MLQALSQDAQPLVAVSMETLCTASKSLKILARQQPTLAALLFWDTWGSVRSRRRSTGPCFAQGNHGPAR